MEVVEMLYDGCIKVFIMLFLGGFLEINYIFVITFEQRCHRVVRKLLSGETSLTSQQHCYNVVTRLWHCDVLNLHTTFHNVATTLSQDCGKVILQP